MMEEYPNVSPSLQESKGMERQGKGEGRRGQVHGKDSSRHDEMKRKGSERVSDPVQRSRVTEEERQRCTVRRCGKKEEHSPKRRDLGQYPSLISTKSVSQFSPSDGRSISVMLRTILSP